MEMQKCLQAGSTKIADALLCLGVPSHSYEDGRILVYPGIINSVESPLPLLSHPPHWGVGAEQYSRGVEVVLIFDEHWRLKNYHMVYPIDF
jgi:hypothetical protein